MEKPGRLAGWVAGWVGGLQRMRRGTGAHAPGACLFSQVQWARQLQLTCVVLIIWDLILL